MMTISVFFATSSSDARDLRNNCSDSLYRADAVSYPPACHTTDTLKKGEGGKQGIIKNSKTQWIVQNTIYPTNWEYNNNFAWD